MYAEQEYAYCSGQCQASRFPPASCRCICGGRNHGILRHDPRQPLNVTPQSYDQRYENWMNRFREPEQIPQIEPLRQLPNLSKSRPAFFDKPTSIRPGPLPNSSTDTYLVGRAVKRFVKKITGIRSQDDLNNSVMKGLRSQFNQTNTDLAIDRAFTIRQSHEPNANRPELYELYETGEIDQALEMMGKRWVIGRPKIRK